MAFFAAFLAIKSLCQLLCLLRWVNSGCFSCDPYGPVSGTRMCGSSAAKISAVPAMAKASASLPRCGFALGRIEQRREVKRGKCLLSSITIENP